MVQNSLLPFFPIPFLETQRKWSTTEQEFLEFTMQSQSGIIISKEQVF